MGTVQVPAKRLPSWRTGAPSLFSGNGDLAATIPLWDNERGENAMVVDEDDRLHVLFKRSGKTGVAVLEAR